MVEGTARGGPEDADFVREDEGVDQDAVGLGADNPIGTFDKFAGAGFDFLSAGGDQLSFDIFDKFVVGFAEFFVLLIIFVEAGAVGGDRPRSPLVNKKREVGW